MKPEIELNEAMPTVLSLLRWGTGVFRGGRIDSPRLTAELLLCHVLGCDRLRLYVDFEKILRREEADRFVEFVRRRIKHEPLQYITGEAAFMGLLFHVDRNVLIPRPETEVLVEEVLHHLRNLPPGPRRVLDAGVGSGNIAVSLAHYLRDVSVVGIDVSGDALLLASRNAGRYSLGARVQLVRADLLRDPLPVKRGSLAAVVANPPYIPSRDIQGLQPEVRMYEPRIATTDEGDGLSFFRHLAAHSRELLEEGGLLAVETGFNQSPDVSRMFTEHGYRDVGVVRDMSGVGRVVRGVK